MRPKYYIAQAYQNVSNAGCKPSADFEKALRRRGYRNLGLQARTFSNARLWWIYNWLSARLAILRMPRNAVVALQYPEQRHLLDVFNAAARKSNRTFVLVHDLPELRGMGTPICHIVKHCDAAIVHTAPMKKWVENKYGCMNVTELGIFDYIAERYPLEIPKFGPPYKVVFAGRLDKSVFLNKLNWPASQILLQLYGPGLHADLYEKSFVKYMGCCSPDELPDRIAGCHFGLVWDGESTDTCTGSLGEYLRFNSPYKLSSYIASGLPVIVWNGMAMAEFVRREGVGIVVESIANVPAALSAIDEVSYDILRKNVRRIQARICSGYYYDKAIEHAEYLINKNE